jgi:hypothetical protein
MSYIDLTRSADFWVKTTGVLPRYHGQVTEQPKALVVTTFRHGYHWPRTLTGTNILEKRCENTDFSDLP